MLNKEFYTKRVKDLELAIEQSAAQHNLLVGRLAEGRELLQYVLQEEHDTISLQAEEPKNSNVCTPVIPLSGEQHPTSLKEEVFVEKLFCNQDSY